MKKITANPDDGSYECREYKDGVLQGISEVFDSNRTKVSHSGYVEGRLNGLCQAWRSHGSAHMVFHCVDGEYDGAYMTFWHTGFVKESGTFRKGKRVGIYRWYKHDGSLWKEQVYEDDEIL